MRPGMHHGELEAISDAQERTRRGEAARERLESGSIVALKPIQLAEILAELMVGATVSDNDFSETVEMVKAELRHWNT